jgi:sterol desaturase/sphingolipid hydroxylase (fatty acid hydroxylase superfamily)
MELVDYRTILFIAIVFLPLERVTALRPQQRVFRESWLNDLVYLLINGMFIAIGIAIVVGGALSLVSSILPADIGDAVRAQAVWLQSIEAIVVADIGYYLAHRSFHVVPFLWRFHAIHHSIEEMDWLAAHRVHPVDQILTKSASLIPVLALGFADVALAVFGTMYVWQSILIHSNTRIRFGPLRWILASPQFHHWHHANERCAFDKNFAAQLPFIDALARTLYLPEQRMPEKYGTDTEVPAYYHQQMMFPFLPRKIAREPNADEGRVAER